MYNNRSTWGMINARQEASLYRSNLVEVHSKVKKALQLLKTNNPNINEVVRILEDILNKI